MDRLEIKHKKIFTEIQAHQRGTGGGPPTTLIMTDLESLYMDWVTPEVVEGDVNLPEAGFAASSGEQRFAPTYEEESTMYLEVVENTPVEVVIESTPQVNVNDVVAGPSTPSHPRKRARESNYLEGLVNVESQRLKVDEEKLLHKKRKLSFYEERTRLLKEGMDEKTRVIREGIDRGIEAILKLSNALSNDN